MTINGRLLLLVVATGFFVRVWSANDQSRSRCVMRTRSQVAVVCPPHPALVAPGNAVMHKSVSSTTPATASAEETWTVAGCPIPLPVGIAAGKYRVVDDTGRVARLAIAAADRAVVDTNPREVPADFHMTSVGTRRWYFIRLQTPIAVNVGEGAQHAIGDVAPETQSSPSPFLNRKFDFTGYVTSSPSDESVGESVGESVIDEIARPDPPELPVPR